MEGLTEILVDFQAILWMVAGAILVILEKPLERLLKSAQYKLAKKVYAALDPKLLEQIGGQVRFVELIQESIEALSDRELTYQEVQILTKLIIRDFRLDKALGKN